MAIAGAATDLDTEEAPAGFLWRAACGMAGFGPDVLGGTLAVSFLLSPLSGAGAISGAPAAGLTGAFGATAGTAERGMPGLTGAGPTPGGLGMPMTLGGLATEGGTAEGGLGIPEIDGGLGIPGTAGGAAGATPMGGIGAAGGGTGAPTGGAEGGGTAAGGVIPGGFGIGLGGRLIIAVSRGVDAKGWPSLRGGRTIRTVSFFGSSAMVKS